MESRNLRKFIRATALAGALCFATVSQAAVVVYGGTLSGGAESPPNASAGTGTATVSLDPVAHTLLVNVVFSGLTGTTTASHIHAATAVPFTGTAGVATELPSFTGFPLGVTSGTYNQLFDTSLASFYNPSFLTANGGTAASAETALFAAIGSGRAYLNIHTTAFPGGEIRAFLTSVPETSTWAMMLVGFGAIGMTMRRRRETLVPA